MNYLITGGSGTIGRAIARKLLDDPHTRTVRIFARGEYGVFKAQQWLDDPRVRPILGDVQDLEAVRRACDNILTVFHCAALKHVPLGEYNPEPYAAINVAGTANVLRACRDTNVGHFTLISTDKAVCRGSVMGMTKALAERLTLSVSRFQPVPVCQVVRFGNVLGSRGSVLETWATENAKHGSVTLTDPEMTRYGMLPSEAAGLVLSAHRDGRPGLFVLDMPSFRMETFASAWVAINGGHYLVKGARPGEAKHEALVEAGERHYRIDHSGISDLTPKFTETSEKGPHLSYLQMVSLIKRAQQEMIR